MAVHIHPPELHTYHLPGHTLTEAATELAAMAEAGRAEWWPHLEYQHDNGVVTEATVTVRQRKTMPEWSAYPHAGPAARAEWDRFWHALDTHEQGHFDLVTWCLGTIDQHLVGQPADTANEVFQDALAALHTASDAYDAQTSHGQAQGTVLDLGVEAAP